MQDDLSFCRKYSEVEIEAYIGGERSGPGGGALANFILKNVEQDRKCMPMNSPVFWLG